MKMTNEQIIHDLEAFCDYFRQTKGAEPVCFGEAIRVIKQMQGLEPQLYIKDMQTGTIRPYGSNQHDALHLYLDGRTLSYENLQNGDGSRHGDYRLCDNPEGILPEDMDTPEAVYTYICIGGGYLGG